MGSYNSFNGDAHLIKYKDISPKGAGVITLKRLPLNSQFRMELNTKKAGILLLEGKVCWHKKMLEAWRSGIVFNRILGFELDKVVG